MNRYAVIMAGGRGERFWPESRTARPKQFLTLVGERSLIQQSYDRILPLISKENIIIVLGQQHLALAKEQLPDIPPENFLIEPVGRNTAPCIGLAAIHIRKRDPDGIMLVLPADHMIKGQTDFYQCLEKAFYWVAGEDHLVTIGISPSRPETGYGYIEREDTGVDTGPSVFPVKRFVEKPDTERALGFVQAGTFYWNSGIFIWKSQVILERIKEHIPDLAAGLDIIDPCIGKLQYDEILGEIFPKFSAISVDYGIMEKSRGILMVQGDFGWDDLGSWEALHSIAPGDDRGMNVRGDFVGYDNDNCLIYGQDGLIAALGVKNLAIVKSGNVVMVCDKNRTQEIRELVKLCKNKKLEQYL